MQNERIVNNIVFPNKHLFITPVSASRFYRFVLIVTHSSSKVSESVRSKGVSNQSELSAMSAQSSTVVTELPLMHMIRKSQMEDDEVEDLMRLKSSTLWPRNHPPTGGDAPLVATY